MTDVNVLYPEYLLTATHIMAEINFQLKRRSALEAHAHIWSNDPYYFIVIILCDIYICIGRYNVRLELTLHKVQQKIFFKMYY